MSNANSTESKSMEEKNNSMRIRREVDKLVCNNEMKKPKFLWFLIDSLAFDQFSPFLEQR